MSSPHIDPHFTQQSSIGEQKKLFLKQNFIFDENSPQLTAIIQHIDVNFAITAYKGYVDINVELSQNPPVGICAYNGSMNHPPGVCPNKDISKKIIFRPSYINPLSMKGEIMGIDICWRPTETSPDFTCDTFAKLTNIENNKEIEADKADLTTRITTL